jgi:hypothetical protein
VRREVSRRGHPRVTELWKSVEGETTPESLNTLSKSSARCALRRRIIGRNKDHMEKTRAKTLRT